MDSKLLAIAAAAIIVVAGAGAYFIVRDDGSSSPDMTINNVDDVRLVVYGNANNDDTIDSNDLAIVQSIIDGETEWDKESAPFADANVDGKIDSSDTDLIKNIIDKKTCSVYYSNYKGHATKVTYPIPPDSTIGTMYYQQAQIAILLGLWDRVTACGETSLNDIANPGWSSKMSYGTGYNVDPQTVLKSDVKTVICYTQTDTTASDMVEMVESTDIDLNVLCVNHEHLLKCVCTYGFLFDVTDVSASYLEMADKCSASIEESLKDVSKEDQPSVALVMLYGTATTEKIRVLGYNPAGNTHNLGKLFNSIPNVDWVRADLEKPAYGTYVGSEWFITNQPDYIVLVGSGMGITTDKTSEEAYQIYYEKCKEVFGETNAFKNGNIICASNGMINGYSNPLVSLDLLSYVYEQIDDALAESAVDTWYSEYTLHKRGEIASESVFRVGATV